LAALLETLLGLGVPRVVIGVVLLGQVAVRALDLARAGSARHAEDFI
jgi:hypothetical protein